MDRFQFQWDGHRFIADYGTETIALEDDPQRNFHFSDMDDNQDGLLTFCYSPVNTEFFSASAYPYRVKNAYVIGIPETVNKAMSFSVIDPMDNSRMKYRMKVESVSQRNSAGPRPPGTKR